VTVVILEGAAEDLEFGRGFYESREAGIGDYFVESLLADLDSLILYAGIHPIRLGFHRMPAQRFPFGIYYQVEGEVAYVYAILDMRRDPLWNRRELENRI
jgi:hypothetical protein